MWQCGICGNVNSGPKCSGCGGIVPPSAYPDTKGTPSDLWKAAAIAGIIGTVVFGCGFAHMREPRTMIDELGKRGYRVYGPFPEDKDPGY